MKASLLGFHKDENRLQLDFKKEQPFVGLMLELVKSFSLNWGVFTQQEDKKNGVTKISIDRIKDYEDSLLRYNDNKIGIDVFIGKNKSILILNADKKFRKKFFERVKELSEWKKI